jgi:anthranilate synthase component 1
MDPRVVTDCDSFCDLATGASPATRVPVEVHVDVADPYAAYRRVRSPDGSAFLETGGGQDGWGYFGVDPIERLTVSADTVSRARSDTDAADTVQACSPSLEALEDLVERTDLRRGKCDVPYPCGAVAWLSYDVARELEELPETTTDGRGLPRLQACVYDRLVAWRTPIGDDAMVTLRITACPRIEDSPHDAYSRGRQRALELADRVGSVDEPGTDAPPESSAGPMVNRSDTSHSRLHFEPGCTSEEFAERVRRIKTAIRDGETFQANVSQRLVAPAALDPPTIYAALREVNPAPYAGLLEFPAVDLVSASPELLLELEGETVCTEPIAGTRPRGGTAATDRELETDLRTDAKERAEHAMLVDLERNDVGAVCEYGSVGVPEYRRVDRYSSVMHLVSRVEGTRRADVGLAEAIGALFPGGTITGAPKPRTMALIDEVESTRRGPYTGSIGLFGFDGRATCNIVIRTLIHHDGEYHLRVGAGIVHDSDPEREYQETLDKARGLIDAVDRALREEAEPGGQEEPADEDSLRDDDHAEEPRP